MDKRIDNLNGDVADKAAELLQLEKQIKIKENQTTSHKVTIQRGGKTINIKGARIITGDNITIDSNGITVDGRRLENRRREPVVQYNVRSLYDIERQLRQPGLSEIDKRELEAAKDAQIKAMPNPVHLAWLQAELNGTGEDFYKPQFEAIRKQEEYAEALKKQEVDRRAVEEDRTREKQLAQQKKREEEELKRNLQDPKTALERMEREMFGDGNRRSFNEKTYRFDSLSAERKRLLEALSPEQRSRFKPEWMLLDDAKNMIKKGKRYGIVPPWAVKVVALADDFEAIGDPITEVKRPEAKKEQKNPVEGLPYEEQIQRAQNIAKAYPNNVPAWAQALIKQEIMKAPEAPKRQAVSQQPKQEPAPQKKEKKGLFGGWPFGKR